MSQAIPPRGPGNRRPHGLKRIEYRIPRKETEDVADMLAERFGIDPETVPCDFRRGRIDVTVEQLRELLGGER